MFIFFDFTCLLMPGYTGTKGIRSIWPVLSQLQPSGPGSNRPRRPTAVWPLSLELVVR